MEAGSRPCRSGPAFSDQGQAACGLPGGVRVVPMGVFESGEEALRWGCSTYQASWAQGLCAAGFSRAERTLEMGESDHGLCTKEKKLQNRNQYEFNYTSTQCHIMAAGWQGGSLRPVSLVVSGL